MRWLLRGLAGTALTTGALVSCGDGGGSGAGQQAGRPQGGVSLQAQVRALADGSLRVQYQVGNTSQDPVVLADGVPDDEFSRLPEAQPDGAYLRMRAGGVLEVSRRTFDAPSGSDRSGTALMRGTLLPAGESVNGTITLEPPVRLDHPYDTTQGPEVPASAHHVLFCLGVVAPSDLEATLQGQVDADEDHPVLRHPTRQLLLCSAETRLTL